MHEYYFKQKTLWCRDAANCYTKQPNTAIGEQKYGTQDHCIPTISFTALVLSETTFYQQFSVL